MDNALRAAPLETHVFKDSFFLNRNIFAFSKYWSNDLFNLVTEVPDEECQYDEEISGNMLTSQGCYDPNTHFFVTCDKNPALDQWGYFDSAHHFNVTNYHFFVKDRNDNYIKIWLMSYYDGNGESGRIFFAHKLID